jgi:hypothetical protein
MLGKAAFEFLVQLQCVVTGRFPKTRLNHELFDGGISSQLPACRYQRARPSRQGSPCAVDKTAGTVTVEMHQKAATAK